MTDDVKPVEAVYAHSLPAAQLRQVLEISRLLAITADLNTLLCRVAQCTRSLIQCERASIWLYDQSTHQLFTSITLDASQIRVPADSGIVGAAFTTNQVVVVPDAYQDSRFNPSSDRATGFQTRCLLAAPMVDINDKPVGVIQAVNKIDDTFSPQDEGLIQLLADQAGVAIQRNQLQQIAEHAAEMQREMELARKVQQAMLPKKMPDFPGFDLSAWAQSASLTGGDCYDVWTLPDGQLGILLADASGHGLAPALLVSQVRTLVRALCEGLTELNPHQVLSQINHRLSQDVESDRFITAFLGFLSPDGLLEWQSAGQGPILFRRSRQHPIQVLHASVLPINADGELTDDIPEKLQLDAGGILAVISDGIFESFNPAEQLFQTKQVVECLQQSTLLSAEKCQDALLDRVRQWQEHDHPADDQTIIIVQRT